MWQRVWGTAFTLSIVAVFVNFAAAETLQRAPSAQEQLQQHYDAARTFHVAGDYENAASEYRTFLSGALATIAKFRARNRDFTAAASLFEDALQADPNAAEVRYSYATLRLQQRKLQEARTLAEQAVHAAPGNPQTHALLGRIFFDLGDYQSARQHLEVAVVDAPNFEIGYLLAATYIRLHDLGRAKLLFDEMLKGLGDSPQLHIYFGLAYRYGDLRSLDPVEEFKKAITLDPKIPQAHYFLALACLQRDREAGFAEALPALEAELRINPEDSRAHYLLGYIHLKKREQQHAEAALREAAKLDPNNPDPLVLLGQLYADNGRDAEAEPILRKAIELTTEPSRNSYQINRSHYVLARILLRSGRKVEAEKHLEISKDLRNSVRRSGTDDVAGAPELPDLSPHPEEVSRSTPLRPVPLGEQHTADGLTSGLKPAIADAYNNLGVIFATKKDFASAKDQFRAAAQWEPGLKTVDRNWGMAAFYAKQYAQAIKPLGRELEQHPDDVRVRAALGLSLFSLQNFAKVRETLTPIVAEVDKDPGLQYAYAVSLLKTGDYAVGMQRLRALEGITADSADLHILLGQAYADQEEYAPALEEYHKALALDARNPQLHFLTGLALIRQGNPAEASNELRQAIALRPDDVSSRYHLAFALIQMQQKEEARGLLEQVIRDDPEHATAYYELGKLQLERGELRDATANLEAGVKIDPEADYIHYQLAMAYRRSSRIGDAEREIKRYQELKNRRRGRDVSHQR
jgi:tetratricopeptide (TPR) repeat protein